MIKKLFLIAILPLLLVACWPPDVVDEEEDVVFPPPPVVETTLLEGDWVGAIYFSFTDASGNEENQRIIVNMNLAPQTESGSISGNWIFDTNDAPCSVGGTQTAASVDLIVFCEDITALGLTGSVLEGSFEGNYTITSEVGIPAGVFLFSSQGGE
jgi:hypothetical protein